MSLDEEVDRDEIPRGEIEEHVVMPFRATPWERAFVAVALLVIIGIVASIVAYEFTKLNYSHQSRLRRDCYQSGGLWGPHGCQWDYLKR